MNNKRIQLTLFVDEHQSGAIEKIRREFNPEQYHLIRSHVTLCREDELWQIEKLMQTLATLNHPCLTIEFGPPVRFSEGRGVLLPSVGDNNQFHKLREIIQAGVTEIPRKHQPHITLMHPRNSTCTDSLFEQIEKVILPSKITFRKISLIEQPDGNKWKVLKEFELKG